MITRTDIYNYIEQKANTTQRPVYCTSTFQNINSTFPCVYMAEANHYSPRNSTPIANVDAPQEVTWEVQVFSAKDSGAMTEAYSIMDDIESGFRELGFIQKSCNVVPNVDITIFRLTSRFSRIIGGNDTI